MKNIKINSRAVIPVITFALGVLWFLYGLRFYGWWGDNGPASGFFPSIIGVILAGVSILAFLGARGKESPDYHKASFHPLLAALVTVGAALVIGFFPALFLYILGWLRFYEKFQWRKSLITAILTTALCYGVFVMWLQVPFPSGLVLNLITGY